MTSKSFPSALLVKLLLVNFLSQGHLNPVLSPTPGLGAKDKPGLDCQVLTPLLTDPGLGIELQAPGQVGVS